MSKIDKSSSKVSVLLSGTTSTDTLLGGNANDSLFGDAGNDSISGGNGNDTVAGGDGADTLAGGNGADSIDGGNGDDLLVGDSTLDNGTDTLSGGDGNDTAQGGNGDDSVSGGNGNDVLYGDNGNDSVSGDAGTDTLYGGNGDDLLTGGAGNDSIDGGAGFDTAAFTGNWVDYTITYNAGTGRYTVTDNVASRDGSDTIVNVENLHFASGDVPIGGALNDAPDAINDTAAIAEDAVPNTVTRTALTGVLSNDTDPDDGFGDTHTVSKVNGTAVALVGGTDFTGGHGTLHMNSDGSYTYTLNNGDSAVDALNVGDSLTETFTYTNKDAHGASDTATLKITINGANDAATFSGEDSGSATEDGNGHASGQLVVSDVDNPGDVVSDTGGTYGDFTIAADGTWSYDLDNTNSAVNALNAGDTLTDTITVTTDDGTTHDITITINGANDAATFSGDDTGSATEDGNGHASGQLVVSDVDNPGDVVSDTGGTYGDFSIAADGTWSYDLDNTNVAVNGLNVGDTLTDTITITTDDGTTHDITITINGANDAATFTGEDTGSATEDGNGHASGQLIVSDVDNTGDVVSDTGGTYGDFSIAADGTWSYDLDNTNGAVNALNAGDTLTDTINITTDDGTTHDITITINGANDAATFTGDDTGSATEDGNGHASGQLIVSDVDNPGDVAGDSGGTYGDFSIAADGTWSYDLDNTNSAVNALNTGDTLTDTITVTTDDGTTHDITITIDGANDGATFAGSESGSVTEDGNGHASGQLLVSDVDNPGDVVDNTDAVYGTFGIDADGNWTYDLDNSNALVNALNNGDTLTDTITVTTDDGTTDDITITINGHTDGGGGPPPGNDTNTGNDHDNDSVPGGVTVLGNPPGASGDDSIQGTGANETLTGGAGDDSIFGAGGNDQLNGSSGGDTLFGQGGNDSLGGSSGGDSMFGGSGDDTLFGDSGQDTMFGGSSSTGDIFVYTSTTESPAPGDRIGDFVHGSDKIDVSAIDSDTTLGGPQHFTFNGMSATAHGIWYSESGGNTTLHFDTNGVTGTDEMTVVLVGTSLGLTGSDFIL